MSNLDLGILVTWHGGMSTPAYAAIASDPSRNISKWVEFRRLQSLRLALRTCLAESPSTPNKTCSTYRILHLHGLELLSVLTIR